MGIAPREMIFFFILCIEMAWMMQTNVVENRSATGKDDATMRTTIYRICLLICLVVAVTAGVLLYQEYTNREEQTQWLLV